MQDIVLVEGNNELNVEIAAVAPSIEVSLFQYVFEDSYVWVLSDTMIQCWGVSHIGFRIVNNGITPVSDVSVVIRLEDINTYVHIWVQYVPFPNEESHNPLDSSRAIAIAQPFVMPLGYLDVFYPISANPIDPGGYPPNINFVPGKNYVLQPVKAPGYTLTGATVVAEVYVGNELVATRRQHFIAEPYYTDSLLLEED